MSDEVTSEGEGKTVVCQVLTAGAYVSGALLAVMFLGMLVPRRTYGVPASRRLDKEAIRLQELERVLQPVPEGAPVSAAPTGEAALRSCLTPRSRP